MRPCREPPGLEGLGNGFEKSKWSSVRLVRSGREMTHHLTQKEDRGGGRPQRCLRLASNVEESYGSCVNRLDQLGTSSASKSTWGISVCSAGAEVCTMCGPGSMCSSTSFALGTWKASGSDNCWRSVPVAWRPLRASSYARGYMALKTHAHGCPPRKLQPARPRMSSRKTSEHSGSMETIRAGGSRSGRKFARRAARNARPTARWRGLLRASRCASRCTTEEPPSCGCICG